MDEQDKDRPSRVPRVARVGRVNRVERVRRVEREGRVDREGRVPRVEPEEREPRVQRVARVSRAAVPARTTAPTSIPRRSPRDPGAAANSGNSTPGSERVMIDPFEVIRIPDDINDGLSSAKRSTMVSILGLPRDTFDDKCRPVVNEPMKSLILTADVGPFKVTGLNLAVKSLKAVLKKVKSAHPEVYDVLGTAGMLCARKIRNGTNPSNHSWGCAVDIKIGSILDGLGNTKHDGNTLAGLAAMAPFFNEAGWYWGVGFSSFEDGMHFEIADETIRQWHADGKLGDAVSSRSTVSTNLSIGDSGMEVRRLQQSLRDLGFDIIPDGEFGPITHAIVIDFQASRGMTPDGIVGPQTKKALGLD